MDELIKKLRANSIIVLVLGILSFTWIFLDYLALKEIQASVVVDNNFEWVIVAISVIPFFLLHLFVFVQLFYIFRLKGKFKSFQKKLAQETNLIPEDKEENIE